MAAPTFDMDRAARDWVAAFPRRDANGNQVGGDLDMLDRIRATLGDDRTLVRFIVAISEVAAEAADALGAKTEPANG